jgi:hypothetical protein
MAVWSIVRFNVLSNYKIEVSFADGTTGVADLAPRLSQGPLGDGFDPLCDQALRRSRQRAERSRERFSACRRKALNAPA